MPRGRARRNAAPRARRNETDASWDATRCQTPRSDVGARRFPKCQTARCDLTKADVTSAFTSALTQQRTPRRRSAHIAAQVRHKCGTSAAQVRHKCGTSAAKVRQKGGASAEHSADRVRNGCADAAPWPVGWPATTRRRQATWQAGPPTELTRACRDKKKHKLTMYYSCGCTVRRARVAVAVARQTQRRTKRLR